MNLKLISVMVTICVAMGLVISCQQQVIGRLNNKVDGLTEERAQLVRFAEDSGRIARTYINLYNQEVSKNKVSNLSLRNLQDLSKNREFQFLNQFDGLRKDKKNLEQTVTIQGEIIAKLNTKATDTTLRVPGADSTRVSGRLSKYKDAYNELKCLALGDSTMHEVHCSVPIEGVLYWERPHKFIFKKWRYGKKSYESEFTSPNKWVHIKQHEIIKVLKKKIE